MHKSVVSTIAKKVLKFLDGNMIIGLNFERKEVFEFSVGTLNKEVLNFDSNDDFLIIEGNGAGLA